MGVYFCLKGYFFNLELFFWFFFYGVCFNFFIFWLCSFFLCFFFWIIRIELWLNSYWNVIFYLVFWMEMYELNVLIYRILFCVRRGIRVFILCGIFVILYVIFVDIYFFLLFKFSWGVMIFFYLVIMLILYDWGLLDEVLFYKEFELLVLIFGVLMF